MRHDSCCQQRGEVTFLGPQMSKLLPRVLKGDLFMVRLTRMFIIVLFFVLSSSVVAQAVTRGKFVGPYGIIRVLVKDFLGVTDSDGQVLFESMNVPQKESMLGPGKSIETEDRALQFICANRPKVGHECAIFIHNASYGVVDPIRKLMSYKVRGEKANQYGKLFHLDSQGAFNFLSIDGTLKVHILPGYFEVTYSENGVPSSNQRAGKVKSPKTLVIANVEDTLKISHVRNFWDSLNYTASTRKRFLGMSELFNSLANHNPDFQFIYLTQSPDLVAGKNEREFLSQNGFPRGSSYSYESNSDKASRLNILKRLVTLHQAQRVLLLSHNGAVDVQAFHDLVEQLPNVSFFPYIHIVYSTQAISEVGSALFSEQTGYVTSVELLVDWQQKGFVEFADVFTTLQILKDRILSENVETSGLFEYGIPSFVKCDDFQWGWSVEGDYQFLAPFRDYVMNRCHLQAPMVSQKN